MENPWPAIKRRSLIPTSEVHMKTIVNFSNLSKDIKSINIYLRVSKCVKCSRTCVCFRDKFYLYKWNCELKLTFFQSFAEMYLQKLKYF